MAQSLIITPTKVDIIQPCIGGALSSAYNEAVDNGLILLDKGVTTFFSWRPGYFFPNFAPVSPEG